MLGVRRELRELREEVRHLSQLVERLEMLYVVKDPGNVVSAEAYDGLRRRIAAAAKTREQHLVDLAQLHRVAQTSGALNNIIAELDESMQRTGLKCILHEADLPRGVSRDDAFEVEGAGEVSEVVVPAYVETPPASDRDARGRVHVRGRLKLRRAPSVSPSDDLDQRREETRNEPEEAPEADLDVNSTGSTESGRS